MTQQERMRAERVAVEAIERNFARLALELQLGTPRRHLDVLVELLQTLIRSLGPTKQREAYQERLERVNRLVASRHQLRLVKGAKP